MSEINIVEIDTSVDDRGYLRYCNSFNLSSYVRFYDVINYYPEFEKAFNRDSAMIIYQMQELKTK